MKKLMTVQKNSHLEFGKKKNNTGSASQQKCEQHEKNTRTGTRRSTTKLGWQDLAELAQLELFENFGGRKNDRVEDAGDGEGAADDGADGGQEVIQRGPRLVVLDGDGIQVVSGNESSFRFMTNDLHVK